MKHAGTGSRLPAAVVVLGLVSLLTDVAGEMVQPLVPLYLAALGASALAIGAVEGAAEAAVSFVRIYAGRFADRLPRRKPLVVLGYSLAGLAKPAFALATTWPLALALRVADRVGKGIRGPPRDAMIGDLAHEGRRGYAFGFHRAADTTGAVLGPIVALALLAAWGSSTTTMRLIFLLTAVPMVLAVALLVLGVREPRVARHADPRRGRLPRSVKSYLALIALFQLGQASYVFFVLRAQDLGASLTTALLLYAGYNTVYALASMPMGAASDRVGRRPVLVASLLLYAVAALGFAGTTSLWRLVPWFIVYGLFQAGFETVSRAYAVDLAPADARGTVLGAYHALIGAVALPAGLIAGLLWDRVAPAAPFLVGAGMAVAAAAGLLLFAGEARPKPASERTA